MGMSETLKAISDPARRQILEMLKEDKKTAGEIASRFDLTGATVSYHLATLKKAGLVAETRYKKYIFRAAKRGCGILRIPSRRPRCSQTKYTVWQPRRNIFRQAGTS